MSWPAESAHPPGTKDIAPPRSRAWRLPLVLFVCALLVAAHTLSLRLPPAQWLAAIFHPAADRLPQLVVHYAWLPRFAIALLAGGGLALAGVIFQQVLRNPLAEPLTLGVVGGASLALMGAAIWLPLLAARTPFGIALAGATVAMLATLALTWRKGFAPLAVILAGMIVNMYCSAVGLLLTVLYERTLVSVFIWGGGSLSQNGWQGVLWLMPQVALGALGAGLLARPLNVLALDDSGASQLGLSLFWARLLTLAVAVGLSAAVVSAVGVIGFIGLAGPALARLAGARRLRDRLIWAPLTGAALLLLTDQLVQCLPGMLGELLPTGAAVALLGGPLLLWLLRRMPVGDERQATRDVLLARRRLPVVAALLLVFLVAGIVASLHFADTLHGWQWSSGAAWWRLALWRVPGMVEAVAAGAMLALAGTLLQRVSGNPLASPELLGVSGGAMLGIAIAILLLRVSAPGVLLAASAGGALISLLAILAMARRKQFAPGHVLLAGVGISALSQSILALGMAGGGAYASQLRTIMLGSTYLATPTVALASAVWAAVLAVGAWLCVRWLDILPLGSAVAEGLGVGGGRARLILLLLAAGLTAGATIVVGPLSFVGLIAPHLARQLGFSRARAQMLVATLLGALLMVLANWLQHNLMFPQQVPAGVLATLIGGPYLMWLLRR